MLNCLHIWTKIENFTFLAFCSSAELKQLINFVIHHLPSSLDFCTFTNKTCYSSDSVQLMFGFILGCLTRMPNLEWVSHFQEDLGFYPFEKWYQLVWLSLLRQSPPSLWRLCLFGDSRSVPKMSLVLPVRCCSLSSMVFYLWSGLNIEPKEKQTWVVNF